MPNRKRRRERETRAEIKRRKKMDRPFDHSLNSEKIHLEREHSITVRKTAKRKSILTSYGTLANLRSPV